MELFYAAYHLLFIVPDTLPNTTELVGKLHLYPPNR